MILPNDSFAQSTHSTNLVSSSNQYWSITDGDQSGLDLSSDFSISLWVNKADSGVLASLVDKNVSTGNQRSYTFIITSGGLLSLTLSESGSGADYQVETNSAQFGAGQVNTWIHIAVTVDITAGADTVIFYVNGSSVASTPSGGVNSLFNSTAPFLIGARSAGTSGYFNGKLHDVRIWSRTLSGTEISNIYNDNCTDNGASIISSWFTVNDGNDTISTNDLTNNNTATFSTDIPSGVNNCTVVDSSYWVNYQIMSTSTDLILGNVLEWSFILLVTATFLFFAIIFFKITKK